ncbi:MAG TPA: hypothetical protein VFO71_10490 [Gemmatimonadales bacterium]|nr:hypothetical protein [Gemmatimonadales bacterium]
MKDLLRKQHTPALRLLLIGAILAGLSCGDDSITGPTEGTILVGARTTGSDFDTDGYLVSVNQSQGEEIGVLDTIYVTALQPGDYEVALDDIANNCSVPQGDNPQTAAVTPGDTVEVLFDITCVTPGGGGGGGLP